MKNRKIIVFMLLFILAFGLAIPVSAYLHPDDDFDYGLALGFMQWSKFLCEVQNHHATAMMGNAGVYKYDRDDKGPGVRASASVFMIAYDANNSCSGHD